MATPKDFQDNLLSFKGVAFGLESPLLQSAWFRPHNLSKEGAWTIDAWTLFEIEFTDLLPAEVLIQTKEGKSFIVPTAVWSGYTKPWKSAPCIRKYITNNASKVPLALTNCFEPQSLSFQ